MRLFPGWRPGAFMILDQKGRDSDRCDPRSFRFHERRGRLPWAVVAFLEDAYQRAQEPLLVQKI
jgi:hypothetical protein